MLAAGLGGAALAAGVPDVMVGYLVGPTQIGALQTQHFTFRVQGAGSATAEGVRFDLTSQNLPANFQSISVTQDNVSGGGRFACAILDSSQPSARLVCKGGRVDPHSYVTFDLTTRTNGITGHGQGTLTLTIDPLNTIQESNESNNTRTLTVSY